MKLVIFIVLNFIFFKTIAVDFYTENNEITLMLNPIPVEDTIKKMTFHDGPYMKWKKDQSILKIKYFYHPSNSNKSQKRVFEVDANSDPVVFKGFDYDSTIEYKIRKNPAIEASEYNNVSKIFAVGDAHGEYDEVIHLLQKAKIIDDDLNWIWGDGHLVFIGDLFDRGDKVTELLWFVYNLEFQAENAGGKVHLIFGNHEAMVFFDDRRYLAPKYKYFLDYYNFTLPSVLNEKTVLGKWLLSKNTVIKINDVLFVHAGISPKMNAMNLSMDQLNDTIRNLVQNYKVIYQPAIHNFLFGYDGPLWYRGYVVGTGWSNLIPIEELEKTLSMYNVSTIIHGHTGVKSIMQNFNGKVFNIHVPFDADNILHKGLLIKDDAFISIDMNGDERLLKKRKDK